MPPTKGAMAVRTPSGHLSKQYGTVLTVLTNQDCVMKSVSNSFVLNLTLQSDIEWRLTKKISPNSYMYVFHPK